MSTHYYHTTPNTLLAYLEFVAGDDPVAFAEDAETLRSWIETAA
jgi:hypothetical protein